jgi:putative ABC transport system permease protein
VYPNLLAPLLAALAVVLVGVLLVAIFQPVSRRLARRQLARRRSEAVLAIVGATLGTSIIVGALVVGDTLNFSVRQEAYRTLGPIDERVVSAGTGTGDLVAAQLATLAGTRDVDGVLSGRVAEAAAVAAGPKGTAAEPRVLAWDLDLASAATFGSTAGNSGLGGPNPAAGNVVINQPLAQSLHARPGQTITLYLYGRPHVFRIARVVPERGLAGAGFGATVNRNAFLPAGVLEAAAAAGRAQPRAVTFVSNRGGVEGGAALTAQVSAQIRASLGSIGGPVLVDTPKRTVLDNARQTGDALGALFLMIGSFSIIAGALLLVNIFVMVGEERKAQLGMLRAVGMKRSRLVGSFTLEGAAYALAATLPGIAVGIGVGWAVAVVSAQIFRAWSADGTGLSVSFAVTPTSIVNGAALGLLIALASTVATSIRISRFNIIAAIRDLPAHSTPRSRRLTLAVATPLAVLLGAVAIPATVASQPEATYLLPALTLTLLTPALRRVLGKRWAISVVAGAVLLWSLLVSFVRPRVFDSPSMAVFVILGTLIAFSAVALISENQGALLRPARRLFGRPSDTGLAVRLAVAYPLAKRFRTGATLVMYTLITLVLVLLVEIAGVINSSIDTNVANATAGYSLRLDMNPSGVDRTLTELRTGALASQITGITPLTSAAAFASDPGHRTTGPLRALVVGVPDRSLAAMTFQSRLPELATAAAVWTLLSADPRYVVLDQFFGATGGPNGHFYGPGDTMTVTNPGTGRSEQKTIAGVLSSGLAFYPAIGQAANVYPMVTSARGAHELFGSSAQVTAALLHTKPGTDPQQLAASLQARYLSASLVATPIAASVRKLFSANIAFFRLMQGFLALGLLVGVTGLGVVMVRAVRERRRTIGVLRALGFRARTVERSFLMESGLIALQGVLLGCVLGVLTTWLMYQKSAAFDGVRSGFPIEWLTIATLAVATVAASLLATMAPARRAAQVRPAIAVRVAD